MMLSGDECRRTQRGNNNAYCQDNPISWFDWSNVERNANMVRFVASLIAMRRANPTLRRKAFLRGGPSRPGELPDVSVERRRERKVWERNEASLICVFGAGPSGRRAQPGPTRDDPTLTPGPIRGSLRFPNSSAARRGGCSSTRPGAGHARRFSGLRRRSAAGHQRAGTRRPLANVLSGRSVVWGSSRRTKGGRDSRVPLSFPN